MHELVFAAIALFGVIMVAGFGVRFVSRADERFERIALGDSPAEWGADTADAVMAR
jgi:hypothetical protein